MYTDVTEQCEQVGVQNESDFSAAYEGAPPLKTLYEPLTHLA